jgi:hypothetical protein
LLHRRAFRLRASNPFAGWSLHGIRLLVLRECQMSLQVANSRDALVPRPPRGPCPASGIAAFGRATVYFMAGRPGGAVPRAGRDRPRPPRPRRSDRDAGPPDHSDDRGPDHAVLRGPSCVRVRAACVSGRMCLKKPAKILGSGSARTRGSICFPVARIHKISRRSSNQRGSTPYGNTDRMGF